MTISKNLRAARTQHSNTKFTCYNNNNNNNNNNNMTLQQIYNRKYIIQKRLKQKIADRQHYE